MAVENTRALSDLELLEIEMDLLWGSEAGPELVLACARDGVRARIGKQVPSEVARTLAGEIDEGALPGEDLGNPPPQLEGCRVLLEDALGAAVRLAPGSGPSYVIEPGVSFRTTAQLVRSDSADPAPLRAANPGNWGADEWQDLLDGRLGPWVIAMQGEQVISICHTPVASANAAEAGVWTHPNFRGHGHAAATTAEWAGLMRPTGRLLFYSTSRTNSASQRVAARLGLRRIGYLWQLQSMKSACNLDRILS
jgi:RimJ/RimL family protein N-acetyltransferase